MERSQRLALLFTFVIAAMMVMPVPPNPVLTQEEIVQSAWAYYSKEYNISDGVFAGIDFGVAFIVKLAERSPDIADIVVFTLVIGLLFGAVFIILDLPGRIKAKFRKE